MTTTTADPSIWMKAQRPGRPAELQIDCLILGGGLSGLATAIALKRSGHNVTVVERDPSRDRRGTGGGCRLPPNMTKILFRWGFGEKMLQYGSKLQKLQLYRYETGEFLGYHEFPEELLKTAGGDYVLIQWGDLWQILYEGALEAGAEVLTGMEVTSIDPSGSSITVANGDVLSADIVVGADGPSGRGRQLLLDQHRSAEKMPKPWSMYEVVVPAERIARYPDVAALMKVNFHPDRIMLYFGDTRAWHFFPINHSENYAIHYCVEDDGTSGSWGGPYDTDLADIVGNCEPLIRRLAEIADPAMSVRVPDNYKLDHWVHDSQHFVVLGEAAHPFPPSAQQGLAMSFEDAAVFGKLFSHLSDRSQIGNFLYAFEDIRLNRSYASYDDECVLYRFFTLRPGAQQEARDEGLRSTHVTGRTKFEGSEDATARHWEDVKKVFAYDCEDEADEWWVKWGVLRLRAEERSKYHSQNLHAA